MNLDQRGRQLLAAFSEPVAVAFSGGADSALVLAAAVRSMGAARVLAVTAMSASYPSGELAPAQRFATDLGVDHVLADTHELDVPGYRANGADRCWFCKCEVLDVVATVMRQHGFNQAATGTNADDARDPFRPGIRAGDVRGALTPLRTLGFGKDEVRALARRWELPTWAKPASPCLASRIRHGVEVTPFRLARVDRAEEATRSALQARNLGTLDLRVRDLGEDARVEVDASLLAELSDASDIIDAVHGAGFAGRVTVTAFSSGALSREAIGND